MERSRRGAGDGKRGTAAALQQLAAERARRAAAAAAHAAAAAAAAAEGDGDGSEGHGLTTAAALPLPDSGDEGESAPSGGRAAAPEPPKQRSQKAPRPPAARTDEESGSDSDGGADAGWGRKSAAPATPTGEQPRTDPRASSAKPAPAAKGPIPLKRLVRKADVADAANATSTTGRSGGGGGAVDELGDIFKGMALGSGGRGGSKPSSSRDANAKQRGSSEEEEEDEEETGEEELGDDVEDSDSSEVSGAEDAEEEGEEGSETESFATGRSASATSAASSAAAAAGPARSEGSRGAGSSAGGAAPAAASMDDGAEVLELEGGFKLAGRVAAKLYAHQVEGVRWLWSLHMARKGGILADDMVRAVGLPKLGLAPGLAFVESKYAPAEQSGVNKARVAPAPSRIGVRARPAPLARHSSFPGPRQDDAVLRLPRGRAQRRGRAARAHCRAEDVVVALVGRAPTSSGMCNAPVRPSWFDRVRPAAV
jgi:hypothetical protein